MYISDEGPTLETLEYTIRIDSTPTFLYFNLYLYSAYTAHYIYFNHIDLDIWPLTDPDIWFNKS